MGNMANIFFFSGFHSIEQMSKFCRCQLDLIKEFIICCFSKSTLKIRSISNLSVKQMPYRNDFYFKRTHTSTPFPYEILTSNRLRMASKHEYAYVIQTRKKSTWKENCSVDVAVNVIVFIKFVGMHLNGACVYYLNTINLNINHSINLNSLFHLDQASCYSLYLAACSCFFFSF